MKTRQHMRLSKLEDRFWPTQKQRRELGMVVIEGADDGGDGGQIAALIEHGDAQPDDIFVVVSRFGADCPRYVDWKPYRQVGSERHTLPTEYVYEPSRNAPSAYLRTLSP